MLALRFHAGLDLREFLSSGLWQDSLTVVHGALERESQQFRRDENLAMLLDRWNFYLDSEYADWITDPNDPDVKRKQKARRDRGVKPPPRPLLFPIALRPPDVAEIHMQHYAQAAELYSKPIEDRTLTVAEVLSMRKG